MAFLPGKTDLHIHTTVSDGTDTPAALLDKVRSAGIRVFAVCDHDAVKAGAVVRPLLRKNDPFFIQGAEFSCKDEQGKYHVLGYGFDPESRAILDVIDRGHALRMKKVAARLDFLKTQFGFSFPGQEIDRLFQLDNPGKPHIANLMVKYGFAKTKEDAMGNFLNRMRFSTEYIRPEEAIKGILDGGGIPVLAHPFYGSGDELILGKDMEDRLRRLTGFGLRGIEACYSGFSEKLRTNALELAEQFDLFVTAGSDYHGDNKMVRLGDTGLDENGDAPERLIRFLREIGAAP